MSEKPDKRFLRPWVNKTDGHVVLGKRLHPFCLLHLVALSAYDSPLIEGGPVTIEDVMVAVEVCSTEITSLEISDDPPLNPDAYVEALMQSDVATEHAKFKAYMDDYMTRIEVAVSKDSGKVLGQPYWSAMVLTLVKNGHDEWKVWTRPFGQVQAYYHGLQELMTDTQILSEEQQAIIEAAPDVEEEQNA